MSDKVGGESPYRRVQRTLEEAIRANDEVLIGRIISADREFFVEMVENGDAQELLCDASFGGSVGCCRALITAGVDPWSRDWHGRAAALDFGARNPFTKAEAKEEARMLFAACGVTWDAAAGPRECLVEYLFAEPFGDPRYLAQHSHQALFDADLPLYPEDKNWMRLDADKRWVNQLWLTPDEEPLVKRALAERVQLSVSFEVRVRAGSLAAEIGGGEA